MVSSIRLRKPGSSTSSCLQQAPLRLSPAPANPGLLDAATCHAIARSATAEAPRRRSARLRIVWLPLRGATSTPGNRPGVHRAACCRSAAPALVLGLLLHARKRREDAVSTLSHGPQTDSQFRAHRPPDPGRFPSLSSSRAERGQRTNTEPCPRWRPDSATSASLTGSRRPTGSARRASSLPWRNVAASPDQGPARHPSTRPRALVNLLPISRKAASEALPRDRPCAVSAQVRESASLDTRTITAVNTSPRSSDTAPAVPEADCCHNPDNGMCRQQTALPDCAAHPRVRHAHTPNPSSSFGPRSGCPVCRSRHPVALPNPSSRHSPPPDE